MLNLAMKRVAGIATAAAGTRSGCMGSGLARVRAVGAGEHGDGCRRFSRLRAGSVRRPEASMVASNLNNALTE